MNWPGAGGCDFLADPDLSVIEAPVFWRPEDCPAVILLSPARSEFAAPALRWRDISGSGIRRNAADGVHLLFEHGRCRFQIFVSGSARSGNFLHAIIPLDRFADRRLETVSHLLHAVARQGSIKPSSPSQKTIRLQKALLALDALEAKASHREIAEVLYGPRRVSEELWKTSSLRQGVIRLCRLGEEMMQDGYMRLLLD
jgi:hypothetical protein